MDNLTSCKDKLFQNLLPRLSKPFIDQNLQFHIPQEELINSQINHAHSPIYAHYMGNAPTISAFESQVNESDLYQAMTDAEHSFDAWQAMKRQLAQAIKTR